MGYDREEDSEGEFDIWDRIEKEEEIESKKKTLWETFTREGTSCSYKGTPEPILVAGEVIPGFEIFTEYVNGVEKEDVIKFPTDLEELIVVEEEPKEDTTTPKVKSIDDQNEELDLEAYVLNSIMDLFYDDYDVFFTAFI